MSVGNDPVEYEFDHSNVLIIGKNGAGKSTVTDALCFVLYGKPFRSVNKGQLVNSVNGGDTYVELEFSRGTLPYRVIRTIKPDSFEVWGPDGLIEPHKNVRDYQAFFEEEILGMSYSAFVQIVILGSARYTPFMSLSAPNRRVIMDDILNLSEVTRMHERVKEMLRECNMDLKDADHGIASLDSLIRENEQAIAKFEEMNTANETDMDDGKAKLLELIRQKKTELEALGDDIDADCLRQELSEVRSIRERLLAMRTKLEDRISRAKKGISFFDTNTVCPTCEQEVDESFREAKLCDHNGEIVEAGKALEAIAEKITVQTAREHDLRGRISTQEALSGKRKDLTDYIRSMVDDLRRRRSVSDAKVDIAPFHERKASHEADRDVLRVKRDNLSVRSSALTLVRDNLDEKALKADIISTYIPEINARIAHYLDVLGFNVDFEIDETFKETIRSRGRDKFSYESFSEGQKRRIDLALLFTWRDIARMKHSVSTDLLIMDEVFDSSLDHEGTEGLVNLLADIGQDTTIIVISHGSDEMQVNFDHMYRVTMPDQFTVSEKEF